MKFLSNKNIWLLIFSHEKSPYTPLHYSLPWKLASFWYLIKGYLPSGKEGAENHERHKHYLWIIRFHEWLGLHCLNFHYQMEGACLVHQFLKIFLCYQSSNRTRSHHYSFHWKNMSSFLWLSKKGDNFSSEINRMYEGNKMRGLLMSRRTWRMQRLMQEAERVQRGVQEVQKGVQGVHVKWITSDDKVTTLFLRWYRRIKYHF